jgi:hypothetical protein
LALRNEAQHDIALSLLGFTSSAPTYIVFYGIKLFSARSGVLRLFILEKSVERGFIAQDIGFTVRKKNLSFAYKDVGEGREQDAVASPIG